MSTMQGSLLVASVYIGGFAGRGWHNSNHAALTYDVGDLSLEQWVEKLRKEALSTRALPWPHLSRSNIQSAEVSVSIRAAHVVNGIMVETITI